MGAAERGALSPARGSTGPTAGRQAAGTLQERRFNRPAGASARATPHRASQGQCHQGPQRLPWQQTHTQGQHRAAFPGNKHMEDKGEPPLQQQSDPVPPRQTPSQTQPSALARSEGRGASPGCQREGPLPHRSGVSSHHMKISIDVLRLLRRGITTCFTGDGKRGRRPSGQVPHIGKPAERTLAFTPA